MSKLEKSIKDHHGYAAKLITCCVLHFSLVINCHSKRKLREQAVIDAEAAIAAQINRTLEKQAKEDPPPEYELPPTYVEAMEIDMHKSTEKLSDETELDVSLTKVLTQKPTKNNFPPKVAESESETGPSSKKPESKDRDEPGKEPASVKRTDEVECHL